MSHRKVIGLFGGEVVESVEGGRSAAGMVIPDATVVDLVSDLPAAMITVHNVTADSSKMIAATKNAGTGVLSVVAGAASITIVKDTANSVNLYYEGGVLKVQNLTGADVDVTLLGSV